LLISTYLFQNSDLLSKWSSFLYVES
jgi:hypothetical protein